MLRKTLLFRNLVDNLVKNIGLYSVGVLLLLLYRYTIDPVPILLGLIAFVFAYSSVYIINDIFDVDEDSVAGEKAKRKPLTQGSIERSEAVIICFTLLAIGIALSTLLGLLFFGVVCSLFIVNVLYSAPLVSYEKTKSRSLKHTLAGLPLVLIMQFLKILLPWTVGAELLAFPLFFALGFSLMYLIFFRGYKENETVGGSILQERSLSVVTVVVFSISLCLHPEPLFQVLILMYLLAGIAFFWSSHLIDERVLKLAPIYIILGVIILLIAMTYI
ncbi:MAG: UbiA family prenyltransferase [Candidatus Thorarchaeota archaeon]|jgi:4-hydroxybenzoate polyprenyltransferase